MDQSTRDDIRDTYLFTFNGFAVTPTDVPDAVPGVTNPRYARELLGILVNAGLVSVEEGQDGDVWMTANPGSHDDHTLAEAEAVIDQWLDSVPSPDTQHPDNQESDMTDQPATQTTTPTPAKPVKNGNPADLPLCRCGCKSPIGRKSTYKPGHDARHAGQVARDIAATTDPQRAELMLASLGSDALRQKAINMADRLQAKTNAKIERKAAKDEPQHASEEAIEAAIEAGEAAAEAEADPEPEPTPEPTVVASNTGSVKFGRWSYPVKRDESGQVVRATDRNGGDNWVPVQESDMHKVVWA